MVQNIDRIGSGDSIKYDALAKNNPLIEKKGPSELDAEAREKVENAINDRSKLKETGYKLELSNEAKLISQRANKLQVKESEMPKKSGALSKLKTQLFRSKGAVRRIIHIICSGWMIRKDLRIM